MAGTVRTTQGQAWDQIAKEEYGSELLLHKLLEANPDRLGVVLFSGNETVIVPDVSDEEKVGLDLPPWKK